MREEWVDTTDQNFEHFRGSLLLDTKKLFINLKNQSPAVACPQKEIVLYKARRTQLTLPFVSRKGATSVGVNINPILSGKFLLQDPGINGSVFTWLFQSFHVCSAVCLQHGVRDALHSGWLGLGSCMCILSWWMVWLGILLAGIPARCPKPLNLLSSRKSQTSLKGHIYAQSIAFLACGLQGSKF